MKKVLVWLFSLVVLVSLSGCYINQDVNANQMGIKLNRNKIVEVVGPGVYSESGFFTDLKTVDVDTITFSVNDPEVLTKDNQATNETITIQVRRSSSPDAIKNLLTNWPNLVDNNNLVAVISATAREGMKNGTREFTLTNLLDDRNGLANAIKSQVQEDANKYNVEIVNVTIENIGIDPAYTAVLNEKALLRVQTEKEVQRQELIRQEAANAMLQAQQNTQILQQQLETAKAQTAVDVEIAKREGQKVAAANEVYTLNAQAFELEKLRLLKSIFGDKAVFYFVQPGVDLTLLLNSSGSQVVPVTPQ